MTINLSRYALLLSCRRSASPSLFLLRMGTTNNIPLEEAIAVNDRKSLRTAMLNVLKGEIKNSLSAISLALETKDSESSHYAASILSHELSEFRMEVQKLYLGIREEDESQTENFHNL